MLNGLVKLCEEKDIKDKVSQLRKRHDKMKISEEEYTAFSSALIVSLKWAVNIEKTPKKLELLGKTVEKIKQLEAYMNSEKEMTKECLIV